MSPAACRKSRTRASARSVRARPSPGNSSASRPSQERIGGSRLPVLELAVLGPMEESGPASISRSRRDLPAPSRHLSSVMLARRLLISANSATQPTRSSSTFHSPAKTPPGVSTRAISGKARSMSNQCMAWPARTASTLPSGSGISPRSPAPTAPRGAPGAARRACSGRVPPRYVGAEGTRVAVSLPVPAPMSTTRSGWRARPAQAPTGPRPRHSQGGAPRRRQRRRRTTNRAEPVLGFGLASSRWAPALVSVWLSRLVVHSELRHACLAS